MCFVQNAERKIPKPEDFAEARRAVQQIKRQAVLQDRELETPRGSIYDTGEIQMPLSVTEDTTRHLKLDNESETMILPKK